MNYGPTLSEILAVRAISTMVATLLWRLSDPDKREAARILLSKLCQLVSSGDCTEEQDRAVRIIANERWTKHYCRNEL